MAIISHEWIVADLWCTECTGRVFSLPQSSCLGFAPVFACEYLFITYLEVDVRDAAAGCGPSCNSLLDFPATKIRGVPIIEL
jgi:hypothetical protein